MYAAKIRSLFISLLAPVFLCAGPVTNPLTVLVDFERPHSEASMQALRHSLNHILASGGIPVDVQDRASIPENSEFAQLVVFKMRGSCSMSPLLISALADERGPLAMAYTSDGQVLHFGEVECDRVRQSLRRVLGVGSSVKNQQKFGSALAVVIAHEVYHMLGNAKEHTRYGLTKSALTSAELIDSNPSLSETAIAAIKKSSPAALSDTR